MGRVRHIARAICRKGGAFRHIVIYVEPSYGDGISWYGNSSCVVISVIVLESHYVGGGLRMNASWPQMYFSEALFSTSICWIWLLLVGVGIKSVVLDGVDAWQETIVRKSTHLFEWTKTRYDIKMDVIIDTALVDSVIYMPWSFYLC